MMHIAVNDATSFRLTVRDGTGWAATGTTTRGASTPVADRAISKVAGHGTVQVSVRAGALFPALEVGLVTEFASTHEVTAKVRFEERLRVTAP